MLILNELVGFGAAISSGGNDIYTVLLLHCDGTNGSTTVSDSSGSAHGNATITGSAQISTAQSVFGASSLRLQSSNSDIRYSNNSDYQFGSGDWTVDFRVRADAVSGTQAIYNFGLNGGGGRSLAIYLSGTSIAVTQSTDGSAVAATNTFSASLSATTWYHVAIVRTGSVVKCFVNGSQVGSDVTAYTLYNSTSPLTWGSFQGTSFLNGYLDEMRISKGIARWESSFTPPPEAYS